MDVSSLTNTSPALTANVGQQVAHDVSAAQVTSLPTAVVQPIAPVSAQSLDKALEKVNAVVKQYDNNLQFSVDKDTGIDVVKVVDTATSEVIRQLPSPELLAIAKALDKLQGMLIKEKA